jgi:hypothetical protein
MERFGLGITRYANVLIVLCLTIRCVAMGQLTYSIYNQQILYTPPPTSSSSDPTNDSTDAPVIKSKGKGKKTDGPQISLTEVGPRFVLTPIKIFEGSFNGATIYENKG